MPKPASGANKHIFRKILAGIGILLLCLAIFGAYRVGVPGMIDRAITLPSCSAGTQFNTAPFNTANIENITPLGNISPPDHTIPTDHMYVNFKLGSWPVVSPGKIAVTQIEFNKSVGTNGITHHDFAVYFTPCKGAAYHFAHLSDLSGPMAGIAAQLKIAKGCKESHEASNETQIYCRKTVNIKMTPGEAMGTATADDVIKGIDFGLYKNGYEDTGLADPKFYFETNAECPLDYFDAKTKAQIYSVVSRTAEPRCGVIGQDKVGTVQGSWYSSSDPNKAKNNWNGDLAIVHNNHQPNIGDIGIGGTVSPSYTSLSFTPRTTGTVNVEPSLTKAGLIYCYQSEDLGLPVTERPGNNHLLVELVSNTQLKAQFVSGDCSSGTRLTAPTTYYR